MNVSDVKGIEVFRFGHKWHIRNFSHFYSDNNEPKPAFIVSDNFSSTKGHRIEAFIEVCPNGFNQESADLLSVFLNIGTRKLEPVQVEFDVSLLDADGKTIQTKGLYVKFLIEY